MVFAVALFMALLMLSSASLADTYVFPVELAMPIATDISMEDAISIAKIEVARRQGLPSESIEKYTIKANFVRLENGEDAWVVMLFGNEIYYPTDATLIISAMNATVIDYQATNMGLDISLMKQWERVKGVRGAWSLEDQALFSILYAPSTTEAIPGDDMLSKEEATQIALSALPQPPLSPEFQCSFWHLPSPDGTADEYIWVITILVHGVKQIQVNLSAIDGTIIDVFDLVNGLG